MANKKKLSVFEDVNLVIESLSQNEIGKIGNWRKDEVGFIACSLYFGVSEESTSNFLENNLAYYLEGNEEYSIDKIKLILNINNVSERDFALDMLALTAIRTFMRLDISLPEGLVDNIKHGKEYSYENDDILVNVEVINTKIETIKFVLLSKYY